jgi:hypothetical protein
VELPAYPIHYSTYYELLGLSTTFTETELKAACDTDFWVDASKYGYAPCYAELKEWFESQVSIACFVLGRDIEREYHDDMVARQALSNITLVQFHDPACVPHDGPAVPMALAPTPSQGPANDWALRLSDWVLELLSVLRMTGWSCLQGLALGVWDLLTSAWHVAVIIVGGLASIMSTLLLVAWNLGIVGAAVWVVYRFFPLKSMQKAYKATLQYWRHRGARAAFTLKWQEKVAKTKANTDSIKDSVKETMEYLKGYTDLAEYEEDMGTVEMLTNSIYKVKQSLATKELLHSTFYNLRSKLLLKAWTSLAWDSVTFIAALASCALILTAVDRALRFLITA